MTSALALDFFFVFLSPTSGHEVGDLQCLAGAREVRMCLAGQSTFEAISTRTPPRSNVFFFFLNQHKTPTKKHSDLGGVLVVFFFFGMKPTCQPTELSLEGFTRGTVPLWEGL